MRIEAVKFEWIGCGHSKINIDQRTPNSRVVTRTLSQSLKVRLNVSEKETLTMAQAIKATGLSRSTIVRALKRNDSTFPKPVRNGERGNMHFDREEVLALAAARKRVTDLVKSFGVPDDFMDAVRQVGDEAMTDSLQVAKRYRKTHFNVLQSFDRLKCSAQFRELNFQCTEYIDSQNKSRRMIRMTKDGYILLVGKFQTEAATLVSEKYIACFNAMARYIVALERGILMAGDADVFPKLDKLRAEASHHASGLATVGHQIRRCEAHEGAVVVRVSQTTQETKQIALPFDCDMQSAKEIA
jgi:Rha family phage regulatory protein